MTQYTFTFQRNGFYLPNGENTVVFDGDDLCLTVAPTEYTLTVSGETLRRVSFPGCKISATPTGAAQIFDLQGTLQTELAPTQQVFSAVQLRWTADVLSLCFGRWVTVDNYPNCDGENDRWSTRWETQRETLLEL